MPAPKDPEKYKLWIQKLSKASRGSNNPMYGIYLTGDKNGMWEKKHTEASKQLMRENRKGLAIGEKNGMWGKPSALRNKHHTTETKEKISANLKGKLKGKHNSLKTEFKIADPRITGENNPNWKNGITLLTKQIRHLLEYKNWIENIFKRDNYTCQKCGHRGGDLNAHHRKSFALIFQSNNIKTVEDALNCDEFWDLNNGLTLCENCHDLTKKGIKKTKQKR